MESSPSWAMAKMISGAEVSADPRGTMTRLFNAQVSGETIVYSAEGDLLFEGGITQTRGHVGENVGSRAIVEAVQNRKTAVKKTPTYGCGLFSEEQGMNAWK